MKVTKRSFAKLGDSGREASDPLIQRRSKCSCPGLDMPILVNPKETSVVIGLLGSLYGKEVRPHKDVGFFSFPISKERDRASGLFGGINALASTEDISLPDSAQVSVTLIRCQQYQPLCFSDS